MTPFKKIALAIAGLAMTPALSFAQSHSSNSIGLALMQLNAATLKGQTYTLSDIWGRMRQDFRMSEVNPELVRRHEQYYANKSAYFNRTVNRSQPYLYHILSEVEKRHMPAEIALLPFIESAFVTKARSHVGASGLWQFMPATGRHYGLEQTPLYDGRHDVYAATDAALNYLEYLHGLFGDWSLALAAYNWGEGSVGRAIARAQAQGLEPTYENLRMPNETRNYVPKLLAVRNLINNPNAFGLNLTKIDNRPYFEVVSVDQPLDIQAAARLADISEDEFLQLNPSFKVPVFVPKANRKMLLPITSVSAFERNYRQANKEALLSWDVYTAYSSTSLSDLAAQSGMSVSEIKALNNLRSNNIAAGRSLLLAKNSLSTGLAAFSQTDDSDPLLAQAMATPDMQPVLSQPVAVIAVATPQPQAADIRIHSAPATMTSAAPSAPAPSSLAAPAVAEVAPGDNPANPAAILTASTVAEPTILAAHNIDSEALPADTPSNEPDGEHIFKAPTDIVGALALENTTTTEPNPASANINTDLAQLNETSRALNDEAQREALARQAIREALAKADAEEARLARVAAAEAARSAKAQAAASTYTVRNGDTLFSIAQRHNLNVADLVSTNNIKGSNIRPGQTLQVAALSSVSAKAKGKTTQVAGKSRSKASKQPTSYTVKKGDTLHAIASRFNTSVSELQKLNKTGTTLRPGQKIKLTNI